MPYNLRLEGRQNGCGTLRSLEDPLSADRSAPKDPVPEVPHPRSRSPAALRRHSVLNLFSLPYRSAQGRIQAGVRVLPQHRNLEAITLQFQIRPLEDKLPAAGQTPRSTMPDLSRRRRLQDANCPQLLRGLPQTRSPWRPVSEALRRGPVRKLPHGCRLEADHLHGGGSRHDRLPACLSSRQSQVRRLPYSCRQGDALQDQVCAMCGLSQG